MGKIQISEFERYVNWCGGVKIAADRLGCSQALVRHILNGRRAVSRNAALKIEQDSKGRFSKSRLIWGDAA